MAAPAVSSTRPADAAGVMSQITDAHMQDMLATSRTYTAMLLRLTPQAGGGRSRGRGEVVRCARRRRRRRSGTTGSVARAPCSERRIWVWLM